MFISEILSSTSGRACHLVQTNDSDGPGLAWCGVMQTGPLSLVEECRGCALIGQELHSDAGASSLMP